MDEGSYTSKNVNLPMYKQSKFYIDFKLILDNVSLKVLTENSNENVSNVYYNVKFAAMFLERFITLLPMWTPIVCKSDKRYCNAPAETYFMQKKALLSRNQMEIGKAPYKTGRVFKVFREVRDAHEQAFEEQIPKERCSSQKSQKSKFDISDKSIEERWQSRPPPKKSTFFMGANLKKMAEQKKSNKPFELKKTQESFLKIEKKINKSVVEKQNEKFVPEISCQKLLKISECFDSDNLKNINYYFYIPKEIEDQYIVFHNTSSSLSAGDLKCLYFSESAPMKNQNEHPAWLNGFFIDIYLRIICSNKKPISIIKTETTTGALFGFPKIKPNSDYFKRVKITKFTNFILLPLNVNYNHWVLLILDVKNKIIFYLDSANCSIKHESKMIKKFLPFLSKAFSNADDKFTKKVENVKWSIGHFDIYRQNDAINCGVYLLENARQFIENLTVSKILPHNSFSPNEFRGEIAKMILQKSNKLEPFCVLCHVRHTGGPWVKCFTCDRFALYKCISLNPKEQRTYEEFKSSQEEDVCSNCEKIIPLMNKPDDVPYILKF